MIRSVQHSDIPQITQILNHYVENDTCTFQLQLYSVEDIEQRIHNIQKTYPYLVMEQQGKIIGLAYASRWREKQAYDLSAETTVYIHQKHHGHGYGTQIYQALIEELRNMKFHLLVACLTLPNPGSIRLHESLGFEKAGEFKQAGYKFNQWYDVGFWQMVLE